MDASDEAAKLKDSSRVVAKLNDTGNVKLIHSFQPFLFMSFFLNPSRILSKRKLISRLKIKLKIILIRPFLWLGF